MRSADIADANAIQRRPRMRLNSETIQPLALGTGVLFLLTIITLELVARV